MNVRPSSRGRGDLVSLEMYHNGWMVHGLNTISLKKIVPQLTLHNSGF
jgi:hypothetical protein